MVVCKIGGSVLFRKESDRLDKQAVCRLTKPLVATNEALILVHGVGDQFHRRFDRLGIGRRAIAPAEAADMVDLHRRCLLRNCEIAQALAECGLPVVPVHPLSVTLKSRAAYDKKRLSIACSMVIDRILARQMVPVLHGDIALQQDLGFGGVSSDSMAAELSVVYSADLLVCIADVDGVMMPNLNGTLMREFDVSRWHEIAPGGMQKKVCRMQRAVKAGVPCYIVNGRKPGRIRLLLEKKDTVATRLTAPNGA